MSREMMLPSGEVVSDAGNGRELMMPSGLVFNESLEAGAAGEDWFLFLDTVEPLPEPEAWHDDPLIPPDESWDSEPIESFSLLTVDEGPPRPDPWVAGKEFDIDTLLPPDALAGAPQNPIPELVHVDEQNWWTVRVPMEPGQKPLVVTIPRLRSRRHEQQVANILNTLIRREQLNIDDDGWTLVIDGGEW